jgi:hypothetical protein
MGALEELFRRRLFTSRMLKPTETGMGREAAASCGSPYTDLPSETAKNRVLTHVPAEIGKGNQLTEDDKSAPTWEVLLPRQQDRQDTGLAEGLAREQMV